MLNFAKKSIKIILDIKGDICLYENFKLKEESLKISLDFIGNFIHKSVIFKKKSFEANLDIKGALASI